MSVDTPQFEDVTFTSHPNYAVVAINRPAQQNAFRPQTLREIAAALEICELDESVRAIILTGTGDKAFCVGGDSSDLTAGEGYGAEMDYWHTKVHQSIRQVGKPVIAAVNGYALGGGNVLVTICDLAIAADHAQFGQLGPRVGSFDAGFGAAYLARIVGEKKAREIWFLCRRYSAGEALAMGLVNKVVAADTLMAEAAAWCDEIAEMSPTALRFLKWGLNADSDHMNGLENLGMAGVRLFWASPESAAQNEKWASSRKKA
ncbi:MAG: enoyl-CoA hydratase-related protein [Thermoleophilia bacterium]